MKSICTWKSTRQKLDPLDVIMFPDDNGDNSLWVVTEVYFMDTPFAAHTQWRGGEIAYGVNLTKPFPQATAIKIGDDMTKRGYLCLDADDIDSHRVIIMEHRWTQEMVDALKTKYSKATYDEGVDADQKRFSEEKDNILKTELGDLNLSETWTPEQQQTVLNRLAHAIYELDRYYNY